MKFDKKDKKKPHHKPLSQTNKEKMNEGNIIPVCANKTLTYNYIEGEDLIFLDSLIDTQNFKYCIGIQIHSELLEQQQYGCSTSLQEPIVNLNSAIV